MKLDFEGKDDHYTFVEAGELRTLVERVKASGKFHDTCGFSSRSAHQRDSWYGGMGYNAALRALTLGDQSLVAASDALLAKLEDQLPHTSKWQMQRALTGGLVCVPEFLSGQPECMRLRRRVGRNDAPVTIFMDLTSSALVKADDLLKRGTAILALARALVEHRAVELWGGIALGEGAWRQRAWSSTVAWRIDTAPLDLARAAFLLSHPAVARGIGYGIGAACAGRASWDGSWAFGDHTASMRTQTERLRAAMGASELLVIPPLYGTDPLVTAPLAWITRELARLTGIGGEVGSEDWNREHDHAA